MKQSPNPQFTHEQELLLWAIRVDHSKDQRVASVLSAGVDWVYLRETAIQHGIIPLLYKRLKKEMADLVPDNELMTLRTLFLSNAARNIRMTQHLLKVIDLLADSDIEAMPFKGPVLAVQAYGDLSMRRFGDLDILIHAKNVSSVYQILSDQGYILTEPDQMSIERRLTDIGQKDLCFSFHDDILELHWKLIERLYAVPLDMDQIWDRSLPFFINGQKVKTLSPEDMVIVLCFHGLKHSWQSLNWLADLVYTISDHPDLKWHDVFVRAESMGLKRIVLLGLFLAHKHGGVSCGSENEKLFASDTAVRKLALKIQLNIYKFQPFTNNKPFFYLKSRERFKDKILFLFYFFPHKVHIILKWTLQQITTIITNPDKREV